MTPTPEDHEAAARKLFAEIGELRGECECRTGRTCLACLESVERIAAALAEAVRVAVEKERERLHDLLRRCRKQLDPEASLTNALDSELARSEAQATPSQGLCDAKMPHHWGRHLPSKACVSWHLEATPAPEKVHTHEAGRECDACSDESADEAAYWGTPPETKERG